MHLIDRRMGSKGDSFLPSFLQSVAIMAQSWTLAEFVLCQNLSVAKLDEMPRNYCCVLFNAYCCPNCDIVVSTFIQSCLHIFSAFGRLKNQIKGSLLPATSCYYHPVLNTGKVCHKIIVKA